MGRWLAHFDWQGLLLGITERSELFPYALIMARDTDDLQLEVTCHDRPAGPARPRTTWSILHGSPDAPGREPAARMVTGGMEQIRP